MTAHFNPYPSTFARPSTFGNVQFQPLRGVHFGADSRSYSFGIKCELYQTVKRVYFFKIKSETKKRFWWQKIRITFRKSEIAGTDYLQSDYPLSDLSSFVVRILEKWTTSGNEIRSSTFQSFNLKNRPLCNAALLMPFNFNDRLVVCRLKVLVWFKIGSTKKSTIINVPFRVGSSVS